MKLIARICFAGLVLAASSLVAQAQLATPELVYQDQRPQGVLTFITVGLANWSAFGGDPAAPAPELKPCSRVPGAARTTVRIYNAETNRYIYGFCGREKSSQLRRLTFAVSTVGKPKSVYVVVRDRVAKQSAKSNSVAVP